MFGAGARPNNLPLEGACEFNSFKACVTLKPLTLSKRLKNVVTHELHSIEQACGEFICKKAAWGLL